MPGSIQSLERAAAILRLLAGGERRLGLSDVASSLGLAKGTAHGLLRTLRSEGLVEQDAASGKYQLGAELLRLGTGYLDGHQLRARALRWTDDLARATGEAAYVAVPHRDGVLVVHHVPRPGEPPRTGAMLPLHGSALGRVLCAYDPVTRAEPAGGPGFEAELAATRARGFAVDLEPAGGGTASVAALVRDGRRMPVGAVGVTGAAERMCDAGGVLAGVVAAVRDCARGISGDLGAGRA